jgi:hypothetical protein
MKTVAEIAKMLDGQEYGRHFPPGEAVRAAKDAGAVICYGASDDLVELTGKWDDETGAPGVVALGEDGILTPECPDDRCPHEIARKVKAPQLKVIWHDKGNPCWTIETAIPHETFQLMEDGEVFGVGIVFSVDAVKALLP